MKTTLYFQALQSRPDRAAIRLEWIERAIEQPVREVVQEDGRVRLWPPIAEMEGRYLRVILAAGSGDDPQRLLRPRIQAMKITYFQDTGTLHLEFRPAAVAETRDLDTSGQICGLTVEHASVRAEIPNFSFAQIAAA
jgi:uncharacterized protein YuzE